MAFVLLFSVLLFTFFHEGGHALVGLLFGARLTSFNVDFIGMSAHVGLDASFTPLQQSLVSLAGFGLPLLLVMILLLGTPRWGDALLEWVKVLTGGMTISSLLAWVVLPWVYLAGGRPGDDSITFLIVTGLYPPIVSGGAALVMAVALAVFLRRMEGPRGLLSRFRTQPADFVSPAVRRTLDVLVIVFLIVAGTTGGLGVLGAIDRIGRSLGPPDGYHPAAQVLLSDRARSAETVYTFTLEQPASVSLHFAVSGLTHGPAKIGLAGPGGYQETFFMGGGVKAGGTFTVNPRDLKLKAGQYRVVVTFPQDQGVLTISQKIEMDK
jgi:hypothetical protein